MARKKKSDITGDFEKDEERFVERMYNSGHAKNITSQESFNKRASEYLDGNKSSSSFLNKAWEKYQTKYKPAIQKSSFKGQPFGFTSKGKPLLFINVKKGFVTIRGKEVIRYRDNKGRFVKAIYNK